MTATDTTTRPYWWGQTTHAMQKPESVQYQIWHLLPSPENDGRSLCGNAPAASRRGLVGWWANITPADDLNRAPHAFDPLRSSRCASCVHVAAVERNPESTPYDVQLARTLANFGRTRAALDRWELAEIIGQIESALVHIPGGPSRPSLKEGFAALNRLRTLAKLPLRPY